MFHKIDINYYYYQNMVDNLLFEHELIPLAISVFLIGLIGFLQSVNFLDVLVNIEIMMLGVNFHLITTSFLWGDHFGQVYALCFLAVTAAETAIGLGILILLYRTKGVITFSESSTLKG